MTIHKAIVLALVPLVMGPVPAVESKKKQPFYPEYQKLDARLDTFNAYPACGPVPSIKKMAESGFFILIKNGFQYATCFSCGVKLNGWQKYDIPDERHAAYQDYDAVPLCRFLHSRYRLKDINRLIEDYLEKYQDKR